MNKLELKHICGYLPYGLKANHTDWQGIVTVDLDGRESNSFAISDLLSYGYKPILRPLSDLTKDITHKSETFVLTSIILEDERVPYSLAAWIVSINDHKNELPSLPYWVVEIIQEWMFDIHGLIEQGLAINVNELEENPYA